MRKTHIPLMAAAILAVAIPTASFADGGSGPPKGIGAKLAGLLCRQETASIGKDAFFAKYGTDAPTTCAKAQNPTVKAAMDACKSSGNASDALACVTAKLGLSASQGNSGQGQGQGGQGQGQGQGQGGQGKSGPGQGGQGQGQGQGGQGQGSQGRSGPGLGGPAQGGQGQGSQGRSGPGQGGPGQGGQGKGGPGQKQGPGK